MPPDVKQEAFSWVVTSDEICQFDDITAYWNGIIASHATELQIPLDNPFASHVVRYGMLK